MGKSISNYSSVTTIGLDIQGNRVKEARDKSLKC